MSALLMTVFSFLLLLGLIVLVHEWGHYLGCRLTGVHVEVFSLGFGKRLWGRRWKGTDFRVSLFPIGGYVRMAGDEPEDGKTYGPHDYLGKNRGQRILVVAAGPLMNFILAFLALTLAYWGGVSEPTYRSAPPVLGWVESGGVAERAGFREGDLILSMDGKKVGSWGDLEMVVASSPGTLFWVHLQREGKDLNLKLPVASQGNPPVGDAGWIFPLEARMDEVVSGEAADKAGLKPGDTVLKVDGVPVRNYYHFMSLFQGRPGERMSMTVEREGKELELQVVPARDEEGKGRLGVRPVFPMRVVAPGLGTAIQRSFTELRRMAGMTLDAFRRLLVGKLSPTTLSGPLEIARYSRAALASGWQSFLILVAFISLQLGLVNLFPLPALDGGNLLIFTVEAILRRDLSLNMKIWLMNGSFLFLMGLMAFVLLNDIAKILPSGWASFWPF